MNESISFIIGIMGLSWVLVLVATAFTPYFIPKDICFGISIPESEYHDPKIKALRRNYSVSCLVIGLILGIGSTACYVWEPAEPTMWIQLGGIFLYLVFSTFLYFLMHSRIKTIKRASDWVIDTETVTEISGKSDKTLGTAWYLLYLFLIAVTIFVAVLKYSSLPPQIPMHYNIAGEVDRYAAKSIGVFAIMPLMQLFIGLLFAGINLGIGMSGTQRNFRRTQAFRGIMSIFLFVMGLMVMLLFACIQLTMLSVLSGKLMMFLSFAFFVVIFGICIYLGAKVGQGGSRLNIGEDDPVNKVDDDRYWKGGFVYSNKNDPALFVEKRFGIGYTLNFGNPESFLVIAGLVAIILAITVLPLIIK